VERDDLNARLAVLAHAASSGLARARGHSQGSGGVRARSEGHRPELRTLGSLSSLAKQLLAAGLVDRLKLVVCPLGTRPDGHRALFAGLPEMGLDLLSTRVLDERVLLLEYRPAGAPPYAS
jgi:hypothetical protein